jgi:hypothetical protein
MRYQSAVLFSALALASLAAAPAFAGRVVVRVAPPVAIAEPVPAPPIYVWRPGYWSWDGTRYVWIAGAYLRPPRPRATWVPGHWVAARGGWVWVGGRWR